MGDLKTYLTVIVEFAVLGAVPGAIIGAFAGGRRGAVRGAIAGAIVIPLLWFGALMIFYPPGN